MPKRALVLCLFLPFAAPAQTPEPQRPKAGKVEIMKQSDVKSGMTGVAWTVFAGTEPEPIPVEIVGIMKNQWGPKQDIILAKMTGKALRTNVAGGMSGSPVYIGGKLIGAVALRLSVFSPDAICGITPIELMLDVNDFDKSRPSGAIEPGSTRPTQASAAPNMIPIETPVTFAGFTENTLREFSPMFQQMGVNVAAGGAGSTLRSATPAAGWQNSLNPGDAFSAILVSGDMSVSAMCTVTYNDGKNVLGCGHPLFNLGPVDLPMAKSEVLMTLASQFQPNKVGNATEIVGALHQDRHSAIMGQLGQTADMVPVTLKIRSFDAANQLHGEKELSYSVFVHQKWTSYLMMLTLFNSLNGLNDFTDEATYRLNGDIEIDGAQKLALSTVVSTSESPMPAPMALASWWGDHFNRLFLNQVHTPRVKSVNATIDLYPERRTATIENAWIANTEVSPGDRVPLKVFLHPYRGGRIAKDFTVTIPTSLPKGEHRLLISDADTLNHMQTGAGNSERYIDIPQTVALLNQERTNNQVYISLVEPRPTVYYEDKALPSLPASVLNVMQTGRASSRPLAASSESAVEQGSIPLDRSVGGSYSLKITVK